MGMFGFFARTAFCQSSFYGWMDTEAVSGGYLVFVGVFTTRAGLLLGFVWSSYDTY